MSELPKTYEPQAIEDKWYAQWISENAFAANPESNKPAYSIVIPSTCLTKPDKPLRAKKVSIGWMTRITTQDGTEIITSDIADLTDSKPIKL